ncbi:MAG: hypothetical protein Q9224_000528 [Gallowayella concinna]
MPRIKAIATGSTPSFLDVILNFAEADKSSSLESQDTWLTQLRAKPNGRLVMYGDDTWLKLFPAMFARADGTSSFFVSDFTEVDFNVTRNVPAALAQVDWNGMVLHYLGLDHIGHKSGPNSPHMIPKQAEMDNVVSKIYHGLESKSHLQSTLLVLCGDHGMTDAGNHGGSAEGETSPALVFISPKLRLISQGVQCPTLPLDGGLEYYAKVDQSDIAPTLAGLLGFPIPKNNLGVFIPDFLGLWTQENRIRLMKQNADQVFGVVKATFPTLSFKNVPHSKACTDIKPDDARLACFWSQIRAFNNGRRQWNEGLEEAALRTFLNEAQRVMSTTASNYVVGKLYAGTAMAALTTLWSSFGTIPILLQKPIFGLWFLLATIAYGMIMFASSYVEEEHQYWYLIASTWLWWLVMKQGRKCSGVWSAIGAATPFAFMRVIRAWNQTGQKHASQPDIARGIFPAHNGLLWMLVSATYVAVMRKMAFSIHSPRLWTLSVVAAIVVSMMGLAFKISFTLADSPELLRGIDIFRIQILGGNNLVKQARATFLGMVLYIMGIALLGRGRRPNAETRERYFARIITCASNGDGGRRGQLRSIHGVLTLFLIIQSRATNIPLFALFEVQMQSLASMDLSNGEISFTSIILQYASFFSFGGSNAISSIDLSNAYNGVDRYNVGAVGLLTFCGNWAGPLWWTTATLLLLDRRQEGRADNLKQFQLLSTCFVANANMFVMLACTLLRSHLFIWTVFSPKYLYTLAWSLGQHVCINVVAVGLYTWMGN